MDTEQTAIPAAAGYEPTLREVIDTLAPLERRAGSPGEEQAAGWIAERLRRAGCETEIEEEQFLDGYAGVMRALAATGAAAGLAALALPSRRHAKPRRRLAGAVAALATAAIAEDISNGPRLFRRATSRPRTTWNVVGRCGDVDAESTLVVLAHHDAALTGAIFDDRALAWFGDRFPGLLERKDTSLPLWWPVLGSTGLVALGSARDQPGLIATGVAGSLVCGAAFADVHRSPVVPGANDNLTAVAVLIALAEALRAEPIEGLRVLLVSCGAEEVLQGGIRAFAARHFPALDRERTWFLNLDALGSPRLALVEGEGPVVMEDYHDVRFRDLVARAADRAGVPLRRGMRSRTSTDAVIPNRAGYPTAMLTSFDRNKALKHYHLMSDTPENVDYGTVLHALAVTDAVARELAAGPWVGR